MIFQIIKSPLNASEQEHFDEFGSAPPAWPFILLLSGILLAGINLILDSNLISEKVISDFTDKPTKKITITYLTLLASACLVYFCSKIPFYPFNVRTLRRHLQLESEQWNNNQTSEAGIKNIKEKASASITSTAILIAASALILNLTNTIYLEYQDSEANTWIMTFLTATAIFSMTAFFLLLVAVDSLETIFNQFKDPAKNATLKNAYYISSTNPKYYGKISLLIALIMIVSSIVPALGAFGVAAIFMAGYDHWFPPKTISTKLSLLKIAFKTVFLIIPLYLMIAEL